MKKIFNILIFIFTSLILFVNGYGQTIDKLHGDERYSYDGLHSGNQIKAYIYNDGMVGQRESNPEDHGGEWPINSGNTHINQIVFFIGSEVRDINGEFKIIVSEGNGFVTGGRDQAYGEASGDAGPLGDWWSMCPLPGFANDNEKRIAMSHWKWSWPEAWLDKWEDVVDPGWPGSWNGYFGKNVLNADQESYYVMDDYKNREFAFYPDSTDSLRRGLGIRGTIRGFQWSNVLVEDVLFILYDAKNIGTYSHDKMNFGIHSGPNLGSNNKGDDGNDDGGEYNLEEEIGYHIDLDDIGGGGYTPVGLLGLAFFESPGNPYDGIDNDGDGDMGSGITITEAMFNPRVVNEGEDIVVIDYNTFERRVMPMPAEGVQIEYQDLTYRFLPGQELVEIENDLIDNNLNGIIDENNGSQFGEGAEAIKRYLYLDLKCVDYYTGNGSDNILIDEERDDGIDNDGDWDPAWDDVGMDGVSGTGDPGEGDGKPTSGRGTDLPGEPHIDKTDIDESDMIGLTAFNIYTPWTIYPLSDDEKLWESIKPGFLNAFGQYGNTDIMLGSGYFPLIPGQIERFSIGIMFGIDKEDLYLNKFWAARAYHENYNFAKAPFIPTLVAVPGNNRVTLYWDDIAETSFDPITGEDFEGYRIYRSTDPGWNDMTPITDMFGNISYRRPIAQFDLDNEFKGQSAVPLKGVHFWLGDNTGLQHSWTDTTAKNGYKYYYAVTSYDHGSPELGIPPTECSKYISIDQAGNIDKGLNVAIARPEAPAAGYAESDWSEGAWLEGSLTTGSIVGKIVEEPAVIDATYRITFEDALFATSNGVYPMTTSYTLTDVTNPSTLMVLIDKSPVPASADEFPVTRGFRLNMVNETEVMEHEAASGWNREGIYNYRFKPYKYGSSVGYAKPCDYRVEFGEAGISTSQGFYYSTNRKLDAISANFRVINSTEKKEVDFAFWEKDEKDELFNAFTKGSRSDMIIFLERDVNDSLIATWSFELIKDGSDSTTVLPQAGDIVELKTLKPFLSHDVFEFKTTAPYFDQEKAQADLDQIRVVPNPYIVANSWEPQNPYSSGRGPRELHFIHLPPKCTIKIFNVRCQLVKTLDHNEPLWDGTEIWDMQTKDLLDISYGVYIYHVEAGEIGQKIGKFAVIK